MDKALFYDLVRKIDVAIQQQNIKEIYDDLLKEALQIGLSSYLLNILIINAQKHERDKKAQTYDEFTSDFSPFIQTVDFEPKVEIVKQPVVKKKRNKGLLISAASYMVFSTLFMWGLMNIYFTPASDSNDERLSKMEQHQDMNQHKDSDETVSVHSPVSKEKIHPFFLETKLNNFKSKIDSLVFIIYNQTTGEARIRNFEKCRAIYEEATALAAEFEETFEHSNFQQLQDEEFERYAADVANMDIVDEARKASYRNALRIKNDEEAKEYLDSLLSRFPFREVTPKRISID